MQLSAHLDLDVVALEQADDLTLLVELAAPTPPSTQQRPTATLQVVLDRSGSMHGERLEGAKAALSLLVDQLDPTDNFGLVAFDHAVRVVVPAGPLADKAAVKRAIAEVDAGGTTDLSSGYLRGLQEAQRVAGPAGGTLLLISDGHANAGVTDPAVLGKVAEQARGKGVTTSTLGFGLGYDERLLAALAQGGRGTEHFAEEADTAVAKVAGELDGLLDKVVQAASMHVRMSEHVEAIAVLNDLPVQTVDGGVMLELGSFYAGETRKLVLRFRVPGVAALGLLEIATLTMTHVQLPELVQHTTELPVHVNVVPGDQAAGRIPDPVVRSEAMFQETQKRKGEASELLSQGRHGEASALLRSTASDLRAFAAEMPAEHTDELFAELGTVASLADEVDAGYGERAAKAASYDRARKSRTRGRDARGAQVLLRRLSDGEVYLLDEWRLDGLRRAAEHAGQRLRRSGANSPEVALALVNELPSGDPLALWLADAAARGGFRFERP
jgi:Ca-activated chloride channel homolog